MLVLMLLLAVAVVVLALGLALYAGKVEARLKRIEGELAACGAVVPRSGERSA